MMRIALSALLAGVLSAGPAAAQVRQQATAVEPESLMANARALARSGEWRRAELAVRRVLESRVTAQQATAATRLLVVVFDSLLARSARELQALRYENAAALAARVLVEPTPATEAQRVAANEHLAFANYPDDADATRNAAAALAALQAVIRLRPFYQPPPVQVWGGLDSLLAIARQTVLSGELAVDSQYVITQPIGSVSMRSRSTRPAIHRLEALPRGATRAIALDSAGPVADAVLTFAVLRGTAPALPPGRYSLRLVLRDPQGGDTSVVSREVEVMSVPFVLLQAPDPPDSSVFRPEHQRPRRAGNVFLSVFVAAATAGLALAVTPAEPIGSTYATDARAYAVAGGVLVGGIIAAMLDPGHTVRENVAYNRQVREAFERETAAVNAENARRRAEFGFTMRTVATEDR